MKSRASSHDEFGVFGDASIKVGNFGNMGVELLVR
jgi:hypothetical protein